jgi:hypothetical protein
VYGGTCTTTERELDVTPPSKLLPLAALALLGLLAGVGQLQHSSVMASPVCAGATTYEASIGEHDLGPVCAPYASTTTCNYQQFGLAPTLAVTTSVCVPRP